MKAILKSLTNFIFVILAFWGFVSSVSACAFDMIKPEKTKIDWIVNSENLVLARPANGDSFRYEIKKVLVDDAKAPPIPQLVNSFAKRSLASNQEIFVLFAYSSEQGWRFVSFVDDEFEPILTTALEKRQEWRAGMPQSRIDYISALHTRYGRKLERIVVSELDKVPYAVLRRLDLNFDADELAKKLWSLDDYPYQAIHILLLGLTNSDVARKEVVEFLSRVQDWDWADNLGAFAAAYIELEGIVGVEHLKERFLLDPTQPLEKLEQIVMALSVHYGLEEPDLTAEIQVALAILIDQRPQAGVLIARQFTLRSDWSQAELLQPLISERKMLTMQDLLTVSVYVAKSRSATDGRFANAQN